MQQEVSANIVSTGSDSAHVVSGKSTPLDDHLYFAYKSQYIDVPLSSVTDVLAVASSTDFAEESTSQQSYHVSADIVPDDNFSTNVEHEVEIETQDVDDDYEFDVSSLGNSSCPDSDQRYDIGNLLFLFWNMLVDTSDVNVDFIDYSLTDQSRLDDHQTLNNGHATSEITSESNGSTSDSKYSVSAHQFIDFYGNKVRTFKNVNTLLSPYVPLFKYQKYMRDFKVSRSADHLVCYVAEHLGLNVCDVLKSFSRFIAEKYDELKDFSSHYLAPKGCEFSSYIRYFIHSNICSKVGSIYKCSRQAPY